MKKNLLCCALLGAMSMANVAMAQDYDDRWYLSAGAGMNFQDGARNTEDPFFGTLGFGKFISPNWSLDVELNYQNPDFDNTNLQFTQFGATLDARYHWRSTEKNWWPYIRTSLGMQRAEEEYGFGGERKDTFLTLGLGLGMQADYDRYAVRGEVGVRQAFDDTSIVAPGRSGFLDTLASVTVLVKLGDLAAPVEPVKEEVVPQKTCADLDDDGDGVNNCDDKCPGSQAGQAIGPDGCPVPLTIDLKGVNFDFDKDTLRPDAVAILDEAVAILAKYPQLKVEVAGHTDSVGAEAYNQGLSERRAKAVYDYLTGKGIGADRLVGPNGYGESRPIDTNDTREGRARNRRTELNVQN